MNVEIKPEFSSIASQDVVPAITLPPDKSIFHRLLIIGSLTNSRITIPITAIEDIPVDVISTILAMQSLGVPIELSRSEIELQGVGIGGYHAPKHQINCGNSGTTARLLMGLLAGQEFSSTLTGDRSLSARLMKRLSDLLNGELGADIATSPEGKMPLKINGKELHPGDILLPVASAQMKSAFLIAGLHIQGRVSVTEPHQSRNHTENMLSAFCADIHTVNTTTNLISPKPLTLPEEFTYHVPGDISSAGFLIAAAILSRKNVTLSNVGLNPTRKRFLDILTASGLEIEVSHVKEEWNEISGTVEIFGADSTVVKPLEIRPEDIPLLIDEIPLLAVIASFCNGQTIITNAGELRNKESDRISALVSNLKALGVNVSGKRGWNCHFNGDQYFVPRGGTIEHYGDHRIAMALSVMALRSKEPVTISDASVVSISYPRFFEDLTLLTDRQRIRIS